MDTLGDAFSIGTILLEGGGRTNGAFLKAGRSLTGEGVSIRNAAASCAMAQRPDQGDEGR
jgi:riboflavin biosynthesis pyrimidine reductase